MLPVLLSSLADAPRWVAWQGQTRNGKVTKVPYDPATGRGAKADDPRTWNTRALADKRAEALPKPHGIGGIGLELGDLGDGRILAGVDLDTCRNEAGEFAPWAIEVIERFATYTEVSPSGGGAKLLFVVNAADVSALTPQLSDLGAKLFKQPGGDHAPGIEFYTGFRFFAVTEQHMAGTPAELRPVSRETLIWLLQVAGPAVKKPGEKAKSAKATTGGKDLSRSALAFRRGAELRRSGASFEQLVEEMRLDPEIAAWVEEKGLADDSRELRRIWDKADPFTGPVILSPSAPLISARQFIGRCHTLHRLWERPLRTLHHQNATFFTYDRSHYVENTPEEMKASLYRFLDKALKYDGEKLVPFHPNKNRVANIIEALAAEAQLTRVRPPAWLEEIEGPPPGEIIACQNGLLHLPTKSLLPHTPAFFTLNALGFDYQAQPAPPTNWLNFLNAVWSDDPEAIGVLQEFFGLCLTNDTTFQKVFLIVGPRRSGKGTIARVLTALLGAVNTCSPTLSSLSQNFGLSPLIGKYLAIISDARLSGKADHAVIAERLLSISGEDALTIDRKNKDLWTGKLDVRFLVLTNELPRLTDSSGALAGRFIILTMHRSFFGQEDRKLLDKLLPELPGILHWAIQGWERLRDRGYFVPPASSDAATQEMADLGSPIGAFLRDCCSIDQGLSVQTAELYDIWCSWCREHGRDHPGTTQTFGRDLRAAVPGLRTAQPRGEDGKRDRYYEGVGLSADYIVARDGTRADPLYSRSPPSHGYTHPGGHDP